ncbi:hypothetical protein JCM5353_005996 [Sporobolomyces roseus]
MLNHWTYGWFGQPRSNQTVQKSQGPTQTPLRPSQIPQRHVQSQEEDTGKALQGRRLNISEYESKNRRRLAPSAHLVETRSFRIPPLPISTDLPHSRTPRTTQFNLKEAYGYHRSPQQRSSSVRPTPTVSSNTMNRLKAELSSRSLHPTSPPPQSLPDHPRASLHGNDIHQTRRDPGLSQPSLLLHTFLPKTRLNSIPLISNLRFLSLLTLPRLNKTLVVKSSNLLTRSLSFRTIALELDFARSSIFENLSRRNTAIDEDLEETRRRAEGRGKEDREGIVPERESGREKRTR